MNRASLLLALCILGASHEAGAMSCRVNEGPREHIRQLFKSSDAVFSAYVEGIVTTDAHGRRDFHFAQLRVLQVWKGLITPGDLVLGTAEDSVTFDGDGFVPSLKTAVLVYVNWPEPYYLGSCWRTAPLESGTADIPLLNKLSKKPQYKLGG